jgi:hypothetical protein
VHCVISKSSYNIPNISAILRNNKDGCIQMQNGNCTSHIMMFTHGERVNCFLGLFGEAMNKYSHRSGFEEQIFSTL